MSGWFAHWPTGWHRGWPSSPGLPDLAPPDVSSSAPCSPPLHRRLAALSYFRSPALWRLFCPQVLASSPVVCGPLCLCLPVLAPPSPSPRSLLIFLFSFPKQKSCCGFACGLWAGPAAPWPLTGPAAWNLWRAGGQRDLGKWSGGWGMPQCGPVWGQPYPQSPSLQLTRAGG